MVSYDFLLFVLKIETPTGGPNSMPFLVFRRDHLRSTSGIICGPVWGSFAALYSCDILWYYFLRTKAICSRRLHRLISIRVNYMLGNWYISCTIILEREVLFLVVDHNMLDACALALPAWHNPFSSSDSCVWYHTLVLTGNSSYISGNISSPF